MRNPAANQDALSLDRHALLTAWPKPKSPFSLTSTLTFQPPPQNRKPYTQQQHTFPEERLAASGHSLDADEYSFGILNAGPMGKKKIRRPAEAPAPPALEPEPEPEPALLYDDRTKVESLQLPPPTPPMRAEDFSDFPEDDEGVFRSDSPGRGRSPEPEEPQPEPPRSQRPYNPPAAVNVVSSPALSALADDHYEDTGFDTRAWARNVPFGLSPPVIAASPRDSPANRTPSVAGLGTSPSAPPFSLAGSPPHAAERIKQQHTQHPQRQQPSGEDLRGGFGGASPGISPRTGYRMPIRPIGGDNASISVSPTGRPMSMQYPASMTGPRPSAHFRGLSEAEIGMMPSRSVSGRRDTGPLIIFDQAYYDGHMGDVVIASSGTGIHLCRLDREKLTILGTLNGLRGTVLAARMLPPNGDKSFEPTIALIVHGPMLVAEEPDRRHPDMDTITTRALLSTNEVQTTVEVYGIKSSRHLATLYRSPSVSVGPRASQTDPATAVGALAIHVNGSFITVTSGQSGEVYIFKCKTDGDEQSFICLGKTWTSIPSGRQRSYSVSSTSSVSTASHDDLAGSQSAPEMGIVSLSHRWLAVVPPPASSQTSLRGEIGVPGKTSREPPGLLSHTSPAQPSTNCEADTPLDESFINKVARDAAQEAIKGAKRAGEAGVQALKNYWNKNDAPQLTAAEQNAYNSPYGGQASSFPPTHAQDNLNRPAPSTTMISIIDLERLAESADNRPGMLVQPLATFPVRYGCSFLSFNPTGLSLFTSSAKGDVSYVWCLMRMIHGVIATPQGDVSQADNHASVRQTARFSRFTTSNIVDVVWTKPKGEKLAILTERGTVHIHDLPASAFRWPPPAVRHHASPASTSGAPSESSSQQGARSRFGDAISFVQGTAQSFSAAKLRSSLSGATFSGIAATAGAKGGRMVAAGFSRSVGAASGTMSNIRHMGENRISLPGGRKAQVVPGTVALLSGKYQDAIALTGDGVVKLHAIRLSATDGGKAKRSVAGEQISQLSVPKLEDMAGGGVGGMDGLTVRGQWFADVSAQTFKPGQLQAHPLSFAEIETSTPYRTFHNDHRVSMNAYAEGAKMGDDISDDWVFGEDIETEPVDEDMLPAGSMHLGDGNRGGHDMFAFEGGGGNEKGVGGSGGGGGGSGKKKKGQKGIAAEPNYEDLIDMQEEIEASHSSDLSSARSRRGRTTATATIATTTATTVEEDVEEEMPFGGGSEFGY